VRALFFAVFWGVDLPIPPPSSIMAMGPDALRSKAMAEDFFLIRDAGQPIACLFGQPRGAVYYVGKLAVAPAHRRAGLARALLDHAGDHARKRGHAALELQTRVELVENHATFARLGFQQTDATAHPGYARPTSLTFQRAV
jgi:GNAT superfamily N-acetyltransferase